MADRNLDEYQPLSFYKKHTKAKQSGFSKFDVDGAYYFCRYVDGDIALTSQSYKAASGRDNGIESVKKNSKLKERYVFDTRKGNKYGFSLLAGNKQEIAVSPDYSSKKKAEFVAGRMDGSVKAKAAVKKAAPKKAAVGQSFTRSDGRIENYKPLAFYETNGGKAQDGFDKFDKDGAYYFSYRQDGDVVLISESYTSARGRDNGIESVKKNMKLKERYEHHVHKNGKHYFDINAANHQELATSRWYSSKKKGLEAAAILRGEIKPKAKAAAGAAALAAGAAVAATRKKNDEDNYKPLAFYERQTEGREEGIESFKGDDGLHYFAYFENDKIALISEGYPTTAALNTGIASVEKNIKLENRYQYRGPLKNGKYDFKLKAGNGKEIARSVWYGSAAAAAAGAAYLMGTRKRVAPVAAVAAAPLAAAAMAAAPVAAAKPEPVVEAEPVVYAEPEGAGIWGWLRWVLLGLLALLALFFLFKACSGPKEAAVVAPPPAPRLVACWDGSEAENQAACPASVTCWDNSLAANQAACPVQTFTCWDGSSVTDLNTCPAEPEPERTVTELTPPAAPEPVIEAAPEPVRVEPIRAAVAATGLRTIFSPGAGETAVLVRRLGTNPQFGDSHSLTPQGFCGKLSNRYAISSYDANYLDYVAREMGYGGFSEVPASACSNATIPNGSRGMLGYGTQHAYQYSEIDADDPRDLEAFRIRALNGKDVYFMKTCGNYFFITG